MKTLQLTLKDHEFDHADIIYYPDGQRDVQLDMSYFCNPKYPVHIKCRITEFKDLELLLAAMSALIFEDFIVEKTDFVYLIGMRSDRKFGMGQSSYFRHVIAPIINAINGHKTFFDPHGRSATLLGCDRTSFKPIPAIYDFMGYNDKLVIAGDESAVPSASKYNSSWQGLLWHEIMAFRKERHLHDLVTYLEEEALEIIRKSDKDTILIIDDLCDGGATFIHEAKYLRQRFPDKKLHLYVTHGLFSKGIEHVTDYFDAVYTTNSYQDFPQNPDDPLRVTDKLKVFTVI